MSKDSFDHDAVSKQPPYNRSPPHTPPSHISRAAKGNGLAKAPHRRPALPDTFTTDKVRGTAANEHHRIGSDSHDLSWSPRQARDSVVDNMLLSLDQLSVGGSFPRRKPDNALYSTLPVQSEPSSTGPHRRGRVRGHTFSSSLSSDYSTPAADSRPTNPKRLSHGHRSGSSSNFQSVLSRVDSLHNNDSPQGVKRKLTGTQGSTGPEDKGLAAYGRSARRKDSRSSGSSSLDYGPMAGRPRWQQSNERRSSSFDHGFEKPVDIIQGSGTKARAPGPVGRSRTLDYNDFEAAPTPIVPARPRRKQSPPPSNLFPSSTFSVTPQLIPRRHEENGPLGHAQSRAKPGRSSPSTYSNTQENATMKTRDSIPTAQNLTDALPSNLGTPNRKPSITPGQTSASQPNNRPGFFRRVFGSSRNNTPTYNENLPLQAPSPLHDNTPPHSHNRQVLSVVPAGTPFKPLSVSEYAASPPKELPSVPLNKKSSFFRRRKKSVSEDAPIPILPIQLQSQLRAPSEPCAPDTSPVSSLREVMNPYLNGPDPSYLYREGTGNTEHGKNEHDLAYLAGYAARNESSRKPNLGPNVLHKPFAPRERNYAQAKRATLKIRRKSKQPVPSVPDDSFLHDSSGNEGNPGPHQACESEPDMINDEHHRTASPSVSSSANGILLLQNHSEEPNDEIYTTIRQPEPDLTVSSSEGKVLQIREPNTPERLILRDWTNSHVSSGKEITPRKSLSGQSARIWLQPTASEENLNKDENGKQTDHSNMAQDSSKVYEASINESKLVPSKVLLPTNDITFKVRNEVPIVDLDSESPTVDLSQPTDNDRHQAKRIFDGDDSEINKSKAVPWLGEASPERAKVRRAYMELFDWRNMNILASLRGLCGRLLLKGETQQVDRILDAFSTRWCVCNPNHGFKATGMSCIYVLGLHGLIQALDVVHTICYSILLLNTDLHMVSIEQKMTRAQFIKNTTPTIRRVALDAAPDGFETVRISLRPSEKESSSFGDPPSPRAATFPLEPGDSRMSSDNRRPTNRLLTRSSDHSGEAILMTYSSTPLSYDTAADECGPLVKSPFHGRMSTWEVQVEIVLKDFYNSIRQQRLPLFGSDEADGAIIEQTHSANSLSALTGGMLRRTPSMLSKAGSENQTMRGRLSEARLGTGRWSSKGRSRPRLYPTSGVPSSRTSFDDQSSITSPYASSTWSKYSIGKTQTSMSVNSLASSFPQTEYQQSIGFANALSQAIIREETAGNHTNDENIRVTPVLEDESLELAGAPWAKEGILKHKHHLESVDKRAKDRNWMECFAVIEKGWMRLFQFNMNAKSIRQKAKHQKATGGVVGGGNWTENAEALGKFLLRQTIASALPPPGYSKSRPHVWALSLPTGAVHLFQAGTPEIVKEFVTTANYWSARLSKEPLMGGVSNIEYGWSEMVINTALLPVENRPPSNNAAGPRPSLQSSIRSSMDQGSVKPKLPGDRVTISDWTPPQQSMMASALLEVDQLKGLTAYVKNIEEELSKHNELRSVMVLTVSLLYPVHCNV